ncbi:MAG: fumarylacetoacetate hydrolase family protein, partial [Shimia sp.]
MTLLRSWVESANSATTDFPLNNLPYGVFSLSPLGVMHCGVAIGDQILDLARLEENGFVILPGGPYFDVSFWDQLMAAGPDVWAELRAWLTEALAEGSGAERALTRYLVPQTDVTMHLPIIVSEYTDFYASRDHATNVGTMFRGPENALPPNWLHIPIGYNGRASSVVVSGTDIRRPWGQLKGPEDDVPRFAPSARFDYELEIGAIVGTASDSPLSVAKADTAIFGFVLLNDWSARDIQAWEYQPLGPFQSKATATSISPWIVTRAALEPFRRP